MTNRWASSYPADYRGEIEGAMALPISHEFFIKGKAEWLEEFAAKRSLSIRRALDIGCGMGFLHRHLKFEVVGTDVSKEALEFAASTNSGSYHHYDGKTLPFDQEFDLALAITVMHHVPPPDWPAFVREAIRTVKPGGLFIVIEHNPLNPLTQITVKRSEMDFDAVLLRAKTVERLMREANLSRVGTDYLFFSPFAASKGVDRYLRRLPIGAQYATYGFKE